ncbi:MAG: GNAT family N-acetyltransferase [Notoacmeibacter sp.]|nr:GNAT family N-acetyltransferase [Notoacmeibacter sp.]
MWIRTVDRDDLEEIRDLLVKTWHATYDGIYGADRVNAINNDWHSVKALQKRLSKPYSEFVIADDGEEILGVAFASMGEGDDRVAYLHQLYVNPDAQGRGAGKALLIEMESAFPMAARMRLEVEEANAKAIAFYESNGYRMVDRTDNCGSRDSGIPALIFEKPFN